MKPFEKKFFELYFSGKLNNLSDKTFLKLLYFYRVGGLLNTKHPKTFNEKIQWLKLYDHNPLYTKLVDKYDVKKYIEEKIGKEYVIKTIGVWDNFDCIDFKKLPKQFVLKCTHDSGGLYIVKNKDKIDINEVKNKITNSLNNNYFYHGREWPYKNIKPRIIAEEYMEDKNVKELFDYKIMCFNGEPKMLFTCTERYSNDGLKVTFFDTNWNRLPFERKYPSSKKKIPKPKNLDKMLNLSRKLAKDIPFVRIDWYDVNGNLYFGEMTFYPGGGMEIFSPKKYDKIVGDYLVLPKKKNI